MYWYGTNLDTVKNKENFASMAVSDSNPLECYNARDHLRLGEDFGEQFLVALDRVARPGPQVGAEEA